MTTVPGLIEAPADPYKVPRGYGDQQRPGVILPGEEKITWFSRVTAFIDDLDDKEGITKWREAHVLLGAIRDPKLVLDTARHFDRLSAVDAEQDYYVIKAHTWDDEPELLALPKERQPPTKRQRLWQTIDSLKTTAGVEQASLYGSLFHSASEAFDKAGRNVAPEKIVEQIRWAFDVYVAGMKPCREVDVAEVKRRVITDLHAYAEVTADLEIIQIEQFGAIPDLRVGGTWDRIVHFAGLNLILDVKTGNSAVDYPAKLAMQLATYAHCIPYDPVNRWQPRPFEVDQTWGLVVHLPGDGTAKLHWVKIARAWRTVRDLIPAARAWRTYAKPSRVLVPFDGTVPQLDSMEELPAFEHPRVADIAACATGDEVRALWVEDDRAMKPWPEWLNEIARLRITELARQVLADAGLTSAEEEAA